MSFTVRGVTQVQWGPDYILTLDSPDGTSLDADGKPHPLIAKLVKTSNGAPVSGRNIRLSTSPGGEVGDGSRKMTDSSGKVTFTVSDSNNETVDYTATLVMASGSPTPLTATESIQWGTSDIIAFTEGGGGIHTFGDTIMVRLFASSTDSPVMTPVENVVMTLRAAALGPTPVGDGHVFGPTGPDGYTEFLSITQTNPGMSPYTVDYNCAGVAPPFNFGGNVGVPDTIWQT